MIYVKTEQGQLDPVGQLPSLARPPTPAHAHTRSTHETRIVTGEGLWCCKCEGPAITLPHRLDQRVD
ncbi:hypothetical protein EVAR_76080_1 [Eumeta japonica]|uniref:Uncharacterized protein n=1 Tax=Eumeta variegata TaxID=151549 RepID=A0A4C1W6M1_EUMVA|nr:hypothetical protein EVAR_76080_1 [Eumeta japonica]